MIAIYAANSSAGAYVNKLGKYLNQELDGAYKIKFSPMECNVYIEMLFEIPDNRESYGEIKFDISIVSYQNKLRINIIEISQSEKTVGQIILTEADLANMSDLADVKVRIKKSINKYLQKAYPDYYLVY